MAAWLQKRLKDAEALLEQADRTAQRVVVKEKDKPKIPFVEAHPGLAAGALDGQGGLARSQCVASSVNSNNMLQGLLQQHVHLFL